MKIRLIDPDDDNRQSRAEKAREDGLNASQLRRQSIYRDWRTDIVPTVTLSQATWLLLGQDPHQLEPSSASYRTLRKRRYRELLGKLEYAAGAHKLRAVGKPVQGVARRYRLTEVAGIASELGVTKEYAKEILGIAESGSIRPTPYRVADARKRWDIQRQFVASLGSDAVPIDRRLKPSRRRKSRPKELSVLLPFSGDEYRQRIRKFCERAAPDLLPLFASDNVIDQDRRDLNVQVRMGRPRKCR